MTTATRAVGLDIEEAIDSYRRNQRTRLAEQTLDRIYMPRLRALAAWLRDRGMPTDVRAIRREHLEAYVEWMQTEVPNPRNGSKGHKSATVSISYRTMRTFFRWLVADDELAQTPMAKCRLRGWSRRRQPS